jgi:hypothetical protein
MAAVASTAPTVFACTTLDDLTAFVHTTLCQLDHLEPAQTPIRRVPLTRGGKPCGVVFHVEGPRLLRTSAVWSADESRIIFYNSTGERVREVKLSESPEPVEQVHTKQAA